MGELPGSLPVGLLIAFGVLIVLQLTLQITALVHLSRLPSLRVSFGGRKWLWVLIIVFGEIIGPIVYFAAGRLPAPAEELLARPVGTRAQNAADVLYGSREEAETAHYVDDHIEGRDAAEAALGADGTGMRELS